MMSNERPDATFVKEEEARRRRPAYESGLLAERESGREISTWYIERMAQVPPDLTPPQL
jgi:hypothetical protein